MTVIWWTRSIVFNPHPLMLKKITVNKNIPWIKVGMHEWKEQGIQGRNVVLFFCHSTVNQIVNEGKSQSKIRLRRESILLSIQGSANMVPVLDCIGSVVCNNMYWASWAKTFYWASGKERPHSKSTSSPRSSPIGYGVFQVPTPSPFSPSDQTCTVTMGIVGTVFLI